MELIEYVLHTFSVAHIAYDGNETAVGELCFQVHKEVVQGGLCHLEEHRHLRLEALHLSHQFGANAAGSTAYQHHLVGDDLTHIVGVYFDRRALQKVFDLYGIDTPNSLCVCFIGVVKLSEVGGTEDVDVVVEEHLQVFCRRYLAHLDRRDNNALHLMFFHPSEGFLVEREDGESVESVVRFRGGAIADKAYGTIGRISGTAEHFSNRQTCRFGTVDEHLRAAGDMLADVLVGSFNAHAEAEQQYESNRYVNEQ